MFSILWRFFWAGGGGGLPPATGVVSTTAVARVPTAPASARAST